MKNLLLLIAGVILFMPVIAQKAMDVEPTPTAHTVVPYIYRDGSFDLYCFGTVYSYDEDGRLKQAPYEYWDEVNTEWNRIPGSLLIDASKDVRYALEPNLAKGRTNLSIRKATGQIMIEKLGTMGREKEYVSFTPPVEKNYFSYVDFSYIADNGNPVFVGGNTAYSPWAHASMKKSSKQVYTFVERKELNLSDRSVKITAHLINKIPISDPGDLNAKSVHIVGHLNGKLYVAFAYMPDADNNILLPYKIDIWSIDDETQEEKLEQSVEWDLKGYGIFQHVPSGSGENSSLFFQAAYTENVKRADAPKGSLFRAANYKVLEIKESGEMMTTTINVPIEVMSVELSAPLLNCYQSKSNSILYLTATHGNVSDILAFETDREDGETLMKVYPGINLAGPQSAEVLFDERFGDLKVVFSEPTIENAEEICKLCPKKYITCARIDDNGAAKVLRLDFMLPHSCLDCQIERMRLRYVSEEAPE